MIEGRYICESEAQKYVDDGWDVTPLWAHWPYCLACREHKGVNPAPSCQKAPQGEQPRTATAYDQMNSTEQLSGRSA